MTFETKSFLWLLPLIISGLLFLFYRTSKARNRFLESFTSSELAHRLLVAYSPFMRMLKNSLLILSVALIVIALARPQYGVNYQEITTKGIDVLFALDTSKSMLCQDIKPNRLERTKLAILDFINHMNGDRVGLIAFAGNAFLQCPPTLDYGAFRLSLEALDTQVIAEGGTHIAAAIEEACRAFKSDSAHKLLILLTDGEELEGDALKYALEAKRQDLVMYTIGIGSAEGDLIPFRDENGQIDYVRDNKGTLVKSKLDEKMLIRLANATGGFYTPLGPNGEGLQSVYQSALSQIPREEINSQLRAVPIERFQWALGLALLSLILELLLPTRKLGFRKNLSHLVLFIVSFSLLGTDNLSGSPQSAYDCYKKDDFAQSLILYEEAATKDPDDSRLPYNAGVSAYRSDQYDKSEAFFKKALPKSDPQFQQKIFYNLGNTLFKKGESALAQNNNDTTKECWTEAIKNYQNAIDLDPDYNKAIHNLKYVEARLKELEEQMKQQQQEKEQSKPEDQKDSSETPNNSQDKGNNESQPEKKENNEHQQSQENKTEEGSDKKEQKEHSTDSQKQSQENEQDSTSANKEDTTPASEKQTSQQNGDEASMTKIEALKLLDSLKNSEKKMPIRVLGSKNSNHEKKPKKDW